MSSVQLRPGALIATRYRIEAPLASGAMGTVWRARDERLHGRICAVKSLQLRGSSPEEAAERRRWFTREMAILSQLRHRSICTILDVISDGATQHMVMEYVEGRTLAQEVAERGTPGLPESAVLRWAWELADALEYLHLQTPPVVFRDLNPMNIMVRPSGQLTLIDFGIAQFVDGFAGTAIGTAGYAAPEQYQGIATPRSDVYGLAATLHHLLTGRDPRRCQPFSFPLVRALVQEVSVPIEEALERALSMKASDRFASVGALCLAMYGTLSVAPAQSTRMSAGATTAPTGHMAVSAPSWMPPVPGREVRLSHVVNPRGPGTARRSRWTALARIS